MKRISRKRFDVYVDFTRNPFIFQVGEEKGWYENKSRTLFGVILWDYTDKDYAAVLLGRDENQQIRAIEVKCSFADIVSAEEWIHSNAKDLEETGQTFFANGADGKEGIDLFSPVVDESRFHPYFDIVNTKPSHSAAKALISEIAPHFYDIDGNFVEQFQTQGFDSRLWELFLFCYFNEEWLQINRTHSAPDFMLSNKDVEISLEAVIVGRKTPLIPLEESKVPKSKEDIEEETKNRMPIMFGSPLYSKLNHKPKGSGLHYWEYSHTYGRPFVIAIADFHDDLSMTWSTTALTTYLYGFRYSSSYDDNGNLILTSEKIEFHEDPDTGKKIPSGFFFQPGAENISAILHTTSGTISKFNRIGKQCGFDEGDTTMIRFVTYHNHSDDASIPHVARYIVNEEAEETWGEGVSIYHNPNAKHPLPQDFFPSAAQHNLKDDMIVSRLPDLYVYSSTTILVIKKD
ncbi:hypothetical protein [uncultured Anaeromusa sp.]|uniref:hypothetical protein n=1 Tax=uncultured Anaeromusa sp. TaxID=673273 RepID=UPI0029C845D6|nr:hypothetical protein [uncultured Anaeromusa sp.]